MTDFLTKTKNFIEIRRSIIAKMNATKGNLITLKKNRIINIEEKEAIQSIIDAYDNFNTVYYNWKNKRIASNKQF